MEHVEYVYTFGMDDEELERRLTEHGHGVLSLADGGDAYAVPISYSYQDGRFCLRLAAREGSEKMAYADATETASLVVYGSDSADESWSIVVRGDLVRADDITETEINERYQPLRVFGEDVAELEPTVWELRPSEVTGRRTGGADADEPNK
ncbi:pyridoxamine 5'-phosphate oxidase family protein [Haloarchaeobius sp. DFWS5]|uniref:pyridoxamine 5'-phosphate oxidase family protein n=1 Tax=Haloarchaeobius sp. DFWS5 TaxID=3446114 RepID=UPI003EBD3386